MPVLELLVRDGCHLCEDARTVVVQVADALDVSWRETDVDRDPELRAEWGDLVPVVLIDGICHGYYRFTTDRLAAAVRAAGAG